LIAYIKNKKKKEKIKRKKRKEVLCVAYGDAVGYAA
jgi:hypothetical protein